MSKFSISRLQRIARKNRLEIASANLSRRELFKMGLLTSAGFLVAKSGLSASVSDGAPSSPPTRAFIEPLPIMPVKQPVSSLSPAPTASPNTIINPGTGLPFEGRTQNHQGWSRFPVQKFYEIHQKEAIVSVSPDLPSQVLWGYDGMVPGPTYHARYGEPMLVRNFNDLPPRGQNNGFGIPSVSTHLHNAHTPSESDGFACDFFERGQYYDQHYPNVQAGFDSTHAPGGDVNESSSTLWYHDHRVDFTSQNVYKGLAGFCLLFNDEDTGDETTGYRLPSGDYDVPLIFTDKVFDESGQVIFDLFNLDGIIGDKFLVNGKIQPFFQVHPRRYRFRVLDGGPSRFYELFFTDPKNLKKVIPFAQCSNDGNLLPHPLQATSVRLGVAERADIVIDFSQFKPGTSIYLENRLEQKDGRGPTGKVFQAGRGNYLMRFDVVLPPVADESIDPLTSAGYYALPNNTETPLVTRTFRFERQNGMWAVNGRLMTCDEVRFRVRRNSAEKWIIQNNSGGWQHPIHIHFEEHQILSRNGRAPSAVERGRKDVTRLQFNETVELFFRFRDWHGFYPIHCHNTVHEDHAMMIRWLVDDVGDSNPRP